MISRLETATWRTSKRLVALAVTSGAILFGTYCAGEIVARALGFLDFPTYEASDDLGYLPTPMQSGAFLRRNDWVFNDRSMPIASSWTNRTNRTNLLLVGNSIVMGGNAYQQKQKIAPLLQHELGEGIAVWPLAVGGWTTVNETACLEKNPDVVAAANGFIWVLGKGGFKELARWQSELGFPTRRPALALPYLFERYFLAKLGFRSVSELPPQGAPVWSNVERFRGMVGRLVRATRGNGIFLLYPDESDISVHSRHQEWLLDRQIIEGIAAELGVRIIDLSRIAEWQSDMYRDGVHPTVEGNRRISEILAKAVKEGMLH